jgi:hypothetical protein
MNHGKGPHDSPNFVGLQASDEMPTQATEIFQILLFRECFLHPALAKINLPQGRQLTHRIGRVAFADS